jgi:hypothetical protein
MMIALVKVSATVPPAHGRPVDELKTLLVA